MSGADIRIDDDFELSVAEGTAFQKLYVRVLEADQPPAIEIPVQELLQKALDGSVDAQIGWARRLLHGHGVERDPEAAFRWFSRAAGSGDAEALNMVGRCYELGWGVTVDLAEAAKWYGRAAEKADAWGEFNLANLYAQGRGVPYDERQALTLLVRSARRGNPKAMTMIGRFREASNAPRRGVRSSAIWYRLAAKRGCFRGQFHHGRGLVAAGRISDAIEWFRASLAQAPAEFRRDALAVLSSHEQSALREIAAEVSEAQSPKPVS